MKEDVSNAHVSLTKRGGTMKKVCSVLVSTLKKGLAFAPVRVKNKGVASVLVRFIIRDVDLEGGVAYMLASCTKRRRGLCWR